MIDFDNIDSWAPKLTAALRLHVSDSVKEKIAKAAPEYIEDAQDLLFKLTDQEAVIGNTLNWLQSLKVLGYHGSRLTNAEIDSVRLAGLLPLEAKNRRHRLIRALSSHPKWSEVSTQLDTVIQDHGDGNCAGRREGQVHLTLSRAGLTKSFNHYLTHGAEFDQHVAYELLGTEGKELLAKYGEAILIQFAVPGKLALDAAHPYFSVDDMRASRKVPNLADKFIMTWSYRLAFPDFQTRTLKTDCGMMFRQAVPAAWIVCLQTLCDH